MKHNICVIIFALLTLSGCASSSKNDKVIRYNDDQMFTGDYSVDTGVEKSQLKLAEAAVSTSNSLNQLAAMEKAEAPHLKWTTPLDADAIGLGAPASVDWSGPIEPLVLRLANAGGYKFRAVGRAPAIPVIVSIYTSNMPLADILRNANLQAGNKADVAVYPTRRLIELRYH